MIEKRGGEEGAPVGGEGNWPPGDSGYKEREHERQYLLPVAPPRRLSSLVLCRSDKDKRVANVSFDEGGSGQTQAT